MKSIDTIMATAQCSSEFKYYMGTLFDTIEAMTTSLEIPGLISTFEDIIYFCTHDNTDKDDMMSPESVSLAAGNCMRIIRHLSELYESYERIAEQA